MAKSEKSAQKSKRDKSLQKKTKLEPTYKSTEFIEDSSSASEALTPSNRNISVGSTSRAVSIPSTKANSQNGSATQKEKHNGRKKSSDTRPVHSNGDRVEHEETIQKGTSKEKGRINGLGSTTENSGGSGEERSPQPDLKNKRSKSPVKNAFSTANIPNAEAFASGSSTSSGSEKDDVDVPPATALKGKEDAMESNDEDDEVENRGGARGDEADSDAPSEGENSQEASESEDSASSGVEQSVSKAPPTLSAQSQRPIPAYQAPPDFEPAAISLGDAPSAERLFSSAGLEGKELWHIVLPSSVPVSALTEIPPQGILDGSKSLSHDDSDYGLVPHGEAIARSLLIPSHTNNIFTPVKTAFAKSLRLQQLVKVPIHGVNPELRASSSEVPKKKRNQQPEGLRMRYQPFGIPDSSGADQGTGLDSSEQHVDSKQRKMEASQFKPPPEPLVEDSARKEEKKKKRKHGEVASSAPVTPSSSQMKKAKQEHTTIDTTSPPMQSPVPTSTPTSRPGNSQPVVEAKPEDLITITNASPIQLEHETLSPLLADPSLSKKHRHKPHFPLPVTPAQPKHDVSSTSNKGTNKKSHRKASKSEEHPRNKLLQPFRVPRSASPAQTPANGTFANGAIPTAADDIATPQVSAPAVDLGVNSTSTGGLGDRYATAGASPHDLSQRPKKKKKTHKSDAESMHLPSLSETSIPLSGGAKVRDFVNANDLLAERDVDTAAASKALPSSRITEAPPVDVGHSKGVRKQASKSQGRSTPTAIDTRMGERAVDASSSTAVNPSKDVVMQDIAAGSTDTPLDVAAERERKKQAKKALKEARKKSTGEFKSAPIQSNDVGGVVNIHTSSPSLGVAKDAVVAEDSTMQNDSQLFEERERARKKRERKERKRSNIAAEVKPVQAASPEYGSVSTTTGPDIASNGPAKTNSQLYEESERARKKIKKEKESAQATGGETLANTSTSAPVIPAKDPVAKEDDAAPTNSQLHEETDKARRKREKKEKRRPTSHTKPEQEATSTEPDTTANEDTPAPTNSQLYYEGERARKKREEEHRGQSSNNKNKPAPTTNGEGTPAPAHNAAPPDRAPPPTPPANGLAGNDDIAAARAKKKQEKKAMKEERRRQRAMAAAADAAAGR